MSLKKKLITGIVIGLAILFGAFMLVKNMFLGGTSLMGGDVPPPMEGEVVPGEPTYTVFNLFTQDPVTVDATVKLSSDTAYFYQADKGQIDAVLVKDGQKVKKDAVLFTYKQNSKENQYAFEDIKREQTKLYNAREALIQQMRDATGNEYNFRGDQVGYYWGNDGKQVYYLIESIGKGTAPNSETPQQPNESDDAISGLKNQLREINNQIEEVEIKLVRHQEQQNSRVLAKSDGTVILNNDGKENTTIPLVRIVSDTSAVVGSVSEFDFYALADDRVVTIYIPAEDRTVGGKIIDYDKIPSYTGAGASTEDAAAAASSFGAPTTSSSSRFNFIVQPDEPLQPGFSAKVNITLPGFVIPAEAIVEEADGSYVFLHKEGKAVKTKIELITQGLQKVVLKGLSPEDQIINMPFDLVDGQDVTIMDPMAFPAEEFSVEKGG